MSAGKEVMHHGPNADFEMFMFTGGGGEIFNNGPTHNLLKSDEDFGDMKLVPVVSFGEARKLMGQGLIDMWLAVVGSGSTAGVEQKAGKVRLLTLDESSDAVAALQKVVPIAEVVTVEPRPGYLGVEKPIKVMKYDYMLFTSAALADDDAYKLAKTLHENKAELAAAVPAFKGFNPQQMAPDLGVPYHPGAVRFYKDVGIWRSAD